MRKPIITRTIVSLEVVILCYNEEKEAPEKVTLTLSRMSDKKILQTAQDKIASNLQAVKILSKKEIEQAYGMYEEDFITHAMKLDENRKPIAEDQQTETAEQTEDQQTEK